MARRVNTKFLIILTLIIGGGAVAALVVQKFVLKKDPVALERQADEALANNELQDAARYLQQAIGAKPGDPALRVKLGDLYIQQTGEDADALRRAMGAWKSALEVDTRYLPALLRLVDVYKQIVQSSPQSGNFAELKSLADRAVKIAPDNYEMQGVAQQAVIEPWVSQGYPTAGDIIDESVAKLTELMEKDPAGSIYPYWIARAKLFKAKSEGESTRNKLRDEAVKVMADAVARQSENASMHWRAAQVYLLATALDSDKPAREARLEQAKTGAKKAVELAKPEDENLIDIYVMAAEMAGRDGDTDGALALLKSLAEKRPNDQAVRLQQARLMGRNPKLRDQAIAILEQPAPAKATTVAEALRDLDLATQVELLQLKIAAISDITDEKQKTDAIAAAQGLWDKLSQRIGKPPLLLRLQGQLLLARGEPVPAVQALENAREVARQENQPVDYELLATLAQSYVRLGQTGLAEPLLDEILRAHPDHVPSRLMLSQLLLQRNDIAGAERQIKALADQGVDEAQLQNFRIALESAKSNKTGVAKEYGTMPEGTPAEMIRKAQVALATDNRADALRLLVAARQADPKSVRPAMLAALYVAEGQRDTAKALVAEALAADPTDRTLQLFDEQLKIENPTPEQVTAIRTRLAGEITDEYEREVTLFDIERDAGNTEKAIDHLKRAQALHPADMDLKSRIFNVYLQQKDWANAKQLADELGRENKDQAGGLLFQYQLAMAQDNVDEGVKIAQQLVNQLPQFAQSHLAMAQARQRQGQFRQAIQSYQRVLERQRINVDAYRGLIGSYYALQEPDSALRYIEEVRKIRPNDPAFAEAALDHAERFGNPADALPARQEAAKKNPDDAATVARLGRAWQASGRYEAGRNNESAAKSAFQKAQGVFAGAVKKWPAELQFYASLAETQAALGNVADAEKTLRQTVEIEQWKDKPQPHLMMAELLARVGRVADAKVEMRQAMMKANGDVNVRLQLASFLAQTGDVQGALEELGAAGDDPRVERQRIEIFLNAGLADQAEQALDAAIKSHPDSADLKAQQAAVYLATNRSQKAMEMVNEALAKDPENALALLTKGKIQLSLGQADAAIQTLDSVRKQMPKNIDARLTLSQAYRQLNNWNGAVSELEAAIEAQPLNKGLRFELLQTLTSARPPRWFEAESLIRQTRQLPQFAKDPDWMLAEANMWRGRGQFAKALDSVKEAKAALPDNVTVLNNYFDILLAAKQYKQVLSETQALLATEPVPAWVHQIRAIAQKGAGDKDAALAEFEKALASKEATELPDVRARIIASMAREIGVNEAVDRMGDKLKSDPGWQLLAIQLYQTAGQYDQAIGLIERMESQESKLNDAQRKQYLRLTGLIYSLAKPTPQAQKSLVAYVKLLDIEPDSVDVLNNLACLLVDTMQPADPFRAYTYSRRAMDVMTQRGQIEPLIQDTHGWVMTHMPDRQAEGINLLTEVVGRDPAFPDAYYHLGMAYLNQDQAARALGPLQRAKRMIEELEQKGVTDYAALKTQVNEALAKAEAQAKAN